jgi:hypothetical protein
MKLPNSCNVCIGQSICYVGHVLGSPLCRQFLKLVEKKFKSTNIESDEICAEIIEYSQPTDAQQLKAEIRSLLANYESDVVLRGAPKSEGWFFNRLRELSAV